MESLPQSSQTIPHGAYAQVLRRALLRVTAAHSYAACPTSWTGRCRVRQAPDRRRKRGSQALRERATPRGPAAPRRFATLQGRWSAHRSGSDPAPTAAYPLAPRRQMPHRGRAWAHAGDREVSSPTRKIPLMRRDSKVDRELGIANPPWARLDSNQGPTDYESAAEKRGLAC